MNKDVEKNINILHFILQGIHLCIHLSVVEKIFPLTFIEKIPYSPNYLVGVMNFSGKSIPVIDLALRLSLERKHFYSLDTPIILCDHQSHQTGVIVDEIIGLAQVKQDQLQMHEDFQGDKSSILGVIRSNDDLILMLNMDAVLKINLRSEKNSNKLKLTPLIGS